MIDFFVALILMTILILMVFKVATRRGKQTTNDKAQSKANDLMRLALERNNPHENKK